MSDPFDLDAPAQPVPELAELFRRNRATGAEPEPRLFYLQRDQDLSGVSGTGRVADGVLWPDGSCAVRWRSQTSSVSVWSSFQDMVAVHGHNGATRILFHGGNR